VFEVQHRQADVQVGGLGRHVMLAPAATMAVTTDQHVVDADGPKDGAQDEAHHGGNYGTSAGRIRRTGYVHSGHRAAVFFLVRPWTLIATIGRHSAFALTSPAPHIGCVARGPFGPARPQSFARLLVAWPLDGLVHAGSNLVSATAFSRAGRPFRPLRPHIIFKDRCDESMKTIRIILTVSVSGLSHARASATMRAESFLPGQASHNGHGRGVLEAEASHFVATVGLADVDPRSPVRDVTHQVFTLPLFAFFVLFGTIGTRARRARSRPRPTRID